MMKNGFLVTVSVLSILGFSASSSLAVVTVDVYASSSPNFDESPSFDSYGDNAVEALENELSSNGTPSTPGYYEQITEATAKNFLRSTSFNSWRGDADPSGNFSGEFGNELAFGVNIIGDGTTQFRLHDLQYEIDSNDSNDWFDDSGNFDGGGYSDHINGINWGADRAPGGDDDIRYESNSGDVLVDQIVGELNGIWLNPDGTGTNQDQLNELIEDVNGESPFDITATYDIFNGPGAPPGGFLGGGTTTVEVNETPTVPEPATGILALLGSGLVLLRRK